jgi:hypothetical protein
MNTKNCSGAVEMQRNCIADETGGLGDADMMASTRP